MYIKAIINIRFGFCGIQNNQGVSKGCQGVYQLKPKAKVTLTLITLDITETPSNNSIVYNYVQIT